MLFVFYFIASICCVFSCYYKCKNTKNNLDDRKMFIYWYYCFIIIYLQHDIALFTIFRTPLAVIN